MKNLFVFFLLAPVTIFGQSMEAFFNPRLKEHHVQCITAYKIVNGEKQILERCCYDTAGRLISNLKPNLSDPLHSYVHDTIIDLDLRTRIHTAKGISTTYSTVYDSATGISTTTRYQDGKVIGREITNHDSTHLFRMYEAYDSGTVFYRDVTLTGYSFDSLGRVTHRQCYVTLFSNGAPWPQPPDNYTITYNENNSLIEHYTFVKRERVVTKRIYRRQGVIITDSTVYYTPRGKVDKITIHSSDSLHRDVSHRETNSRGRLKQSTYWEYDQNITRQVIYDARGREIFVVTTFMDERGLVLSESNQLTGFIFYSYTFH